MAPNRGSTTPPGHKDGQGPLQGHYFHLIWSTAMSSQQRLWNQESNTKHLQYARCNAQVFGQFGLSHRAVKEVRERKKKRNTTNLTLSISPCERSAGAPDHRGSSRQTPVIDKFGVTRFSFDNGPEVCVAKCPTQYLLRNLRRWYGDFLPWCVVQWFPLNWRENNAQAVALNWRENNAQAPAGKADKPLALARVHERVLVGSHPFTR